MTLNWFLSSTVRHATHMRKHVWRILCAQRDLLSQPAIDAVTNAIEEMGAACRQPLDKAALEKQMTSLETVANKWLKPYPSAGMRENIEVLLVAIAVAMSIRTFLVQPFRIPTGSMQPTLYGVTSNPDFQGFGASSSELRPDPDFQVPGWFKRKALYWLTGVQYYNVVAQADGAMEPTLDEPNRFLLFNLKQTFSVGGHPYTVWFPPEKMLQRAGLVERTGRTNPKVFKKGETILKMRCYSGDHLFVDRLTYNFRRPSRGEIVVFETRDIPGMQEDQQGNYYIKRLVGLGGETLRIGNDRHVVVNDRRLDHKDPHFEKVYSFTNSSAVPNEYSGHVNGSVTPGVPRFQNEGMEFKVPDDHYVVFGDNTLSSYDSRAWGSFPRDNVIGRSFFVYWPFLAQDGRPSRFGWGNR
jgi:signal peptidase I